MCIFKVINNGPLNILDFNYYLSHIMLNRKDINHKCPWPEYFFFFPLHASANYVIYFFTILKVTVNFISYQDNYEIHSRFIEYLRRWVKQLRHKIILYSQIKHTITLTLTFCNTLWRDRSIFPIQ